MRIAPFHPDHLLALHLPEEQDFLHEYLAQADYRRAFFSPGLCQTAVNGASPVACFGVVPLWAGRGWVWAMFDRDIGIMNFASVAKYARRQLEFLLTVGFYRLEATVKAGYVNGRRWAVSMGLEYEGYNRLLDGLHDYELYARVKT